MWDKIERHSKAGGEKMKMGSTKKFFTVIGLTSAALLLIALNGNASGGMTLNNQVPNQNSSSTARPDQGDSLGPSVPDITLMKEMEKPLDDQSPNEPFKTSMSRLPARKILPVLILLTTTTAGANTLGSIS